MVVWMVHPVCAVIVASLATLGVIGSKPYNYSHIPTGGYNTDWQSYYEVTENLPGIAPGSLTRSFAGNVGVNRPGHPNNTLFFWAFEKSNGSLTSDSSDEPWVIWLQGGPGASSLIGLMEENGPIHVSANGSVSLNRFSWHQLADMFWIDQPVGAGFSTVDDQGYPLDEEDVATDFMGFLSNLVLIFPSLASRPLYLMGESYAGTMIPYIMKAYFSMSAPPVNVKKMSIGDGVLGSTAVFEMVPTVQIIETYPQLIDFDEEVLDYFKTQTHLCGYDLNLSYPETAHYPSLIQPYDMPGYGVGVRSALALSGGDGLETEAYRKTRRGLFQHIQRRFEKRFPEWNTPSALDRRAIRDREEQRQTWKKRALTDRANGTIDTWYGCYLLNELAEYAVNYTFPWVGADFNDHSIPDALDPGVYGSPADFLNDKRYDQVVSALHAPTGITWQTLLSPYPWNSTTDDLPGCNPNGDISVEPMAFLSELAANASAEGIGMIFYSGNDDALAAHRGTEVVIQNMTWGGIQGFTQRPSTPWYDQEGNKAGIVHQERNVTYAMFLNAGHQVPEYAPLAAYTFFEQFVLGNNSTGLLQDDVVIQETETVYADGVIMGNPGIFYGAHSTQSTYTVPTATWEDWKNMLGTATAPVASSSLKVSHSAAISNRYLDHFPIANIFICFIAINLFFIL